MYIGEGILITYDASFVGGLSPQITSWPEVLAPLDSEVWDETDWEDATFKYKMPGIDSNKRKRPELRKQRSLPTNGESNQEDRRVLNKSPRKL